MKDLISELYYLISSEMDLSDIYRAAEKAEPLYAELCGALGVDRGDDIWNTAVSVGSAEVEPAFLAGLRLGAQLMVKIL